MIENDEEEEIEAEHQDTAAPDNTAASISTAEPEMLDQEEMPVEPEIHPSENDSDDS